MCNSGIDMEACDYFYDPTDETAGFILYFDHGYRSGRVDCFAFAL